VRVIAAGETLARQTGLLDARRRPVRGLPNRLTTGSPEELAGLWRGAFLAAGSLSEPGRSAMLEVSCPTGEAAMALVGAAHRLGVTAKAREVRGLPRVVVREGESIRAILSAMGAGRTAAAWEEMRQRREVRAGVNRLVNFDDANLRRSAQAAVAACARVERALEAEFARQVAILERGEKVHQQTMLWDGARGEVRPARSKEESHDYRYFPEPDLPPLRLDPDWIAEVKKGLPELPQARQKRFADEYSLPPGDIEVLTSSPALADYFEGVARQSEDAKAAAN